MKKYLSPNLFGLSLVLISVFCYPALLFGAVSGTAHELAIGEQDACSACHVPLASFGEGLWPAPLSSEDSGFGDAYLICYYCHGAGGGAGLPETSQSFSIQSEVGVLSHGLDSTKLPSPVDILDPSLPYGDDGMLLCTTCHDVHDNTSWPFLRYDIDVLCARCHKERQFVGGTAEPVQGAWGNYYGLKNPGSHPMGIDVFDDSDGNSPVDLTAAGVFNLPYGSVGGHLIDGATLPGKGAGITCVTCHATHGVQPERGSLGSSTPPNPNLLVIEQPTASGPYGGTVYNGNGDARNALCEACHTGAAESIDAGTGATYPGKNNINPGATAYSHPVDDMGASGFLTAESAVDGWPIGNSPGDGVSYGLICESYHTPHPAANINRPTIQAASGTHILRATEDESDPEYICTQCHAAAEDDTICHPANVVMGRMWDPDIGNNDGILTCDDCHFSGAHNWIEFGLGLDPDWEPANNARGSEQKERTSANTSKECVDCHYNANNNSGPTNNFTNDGSIVSHSRRSSDSPEGAAQSGHYQDIGEGTHYQGPTSLDYTFGIFKGDAFSAQTEYWTGQGQPNPRWSRFDGPNGTVVCESCHELEADKRVPNTALLLAHYNEGGKGPEDDPSGLCEGCHGHSPGEIGSSHPMTGDLVFRTGKLLVTSGPFTRRSLEGNTTYPATNALNCDSCHQPHDADTHGGTYIYDSGESTTPQHDVTSSNEIDGKVRGSKIPDIQDSSFCTSCHSDLY